MNKQDGVDNEEQQDEDSNPTKIASARERQQDEDHKRKLERTIEEFEEDINNNEGLGVAPRRSQ